MMRSGQVIGLCAFILESIRGSGMPIVTMPGVSTAFKLTYSLRDAWKEIRLAVYTDARGLTTFGSILSSRTDLILEKNKADHRAQSVHPFQQHHCKQ